VELPARRGSTIFYRGRTLLSRIDPAGQAERFINDLDVKDRTLYLCPSPLYGYGLSLLLDKLKNGSAILCVENDIRLFELSLKTMKPLLENENRIKLMRPKTSVNAEAEICSYVRNQWGERKFRRLETLRLTGGWQLSPEFYERTAAALQKDIALSWGNAMTLIKLGRLYIRNAVKNLALLPEAGSISEPDFGEDPILVLGAGPGMDIALDSFITGEERNFRIICADTCLPSLKERSVRPDLVVILESQHWNLRDFLNVRGWKIPAAMDLSALPASGRILGGDIFFFMTPWTDLRLFARLKKAGLLPPRLSPLGSVGLAAAELATRIGKGPIITAGLDFSFTLDAYHARSTPGHLARLAAVNRLKSPLGAETAFREGTYKTQSKSGNPVRSDPALRNYRNLFENEFSGIGRMYEIEGSGLPLGLKQLSIPQAKKILTENKSRNSGITETKNRIADVTQINEFIKIEKTNLEKLKNILTGNLPAQPAELEELIDASDYLWAHFPECAAAGSSRPPITDLGFLKRIRMEIDPFLNLWKPQ